MSQQPFVPPPPVNVAGSPGWVSPKGRVVVFPSVEAAQASGVQPDNIIPMPENVQIAARARARAQSTSGQLSPIGMAVGGAAVGALASALFGKGALVGAGLGAAAGLGWGMVRDRKAAAGG